MTKVSSQSPESPAPKQPGDAKQSVCETADSSSSPRDSSAAPDSVPNDENPEPSPPETTEGRDTTSTSDTAPPLPDEPAPETDDDGWDYRWDYAAERYIFFNKYTGKEQFENPRVPTTASGSESKAPSAPPLPQEAVMGTGVAGGYNPAIHGDYDPNAWYAKNEEEDEEGARRAGPDAVALYGTTASFNRFTGQFQAEDQGPGRHSDEAKSRRQMHAYFDVDAAANAHDGRSLKAERAGKKLTKAELKQFKEKRRARKEEKRRAWLRD